MLKILRRSGPEKVMLTMALIFALFGPLSCGDPANTAGVPTGPDSIYDPGVDNPLASITLTIVPPRVTVGMANSIINSITPVARLSAHFRDANGSPVEGVRINFFSEDGFFYVAPNPSYTNDNGDVSADILILPAFVGVITSGSYGFAASTSFGTGGPITRDWATLFVVP